MSIIWATRGKSWDFRFLLRGGHRDPLTAYEQAFMGLQGVVTVCRSDGEAVALRFTDPLHRKDDAGRVIPHDIVVTGPLAQSIRSVDDGLTRVWPPLADVYAQLWDGPPPGAGAVESALAGSPLV